MSGYFDRWWNELQQSELIPAVLTRVADDLFWGFIDPSKVYNVSAMGRKWWKIFGMLQTDRAKGVRGRLYRNHWSMQSYHIHAINGGRNTLLNQRM